ncbi:hypothetical protein BS78_K088600 [Paspalum vaginatum]|uniref:Uncharacterized protein n=1 Tax=Paspalum vaginatum TaxID=158149 RepID=A0A9W7XCG3_9POAL|nr:hypothetical protein BS78_K088600 [Paspalum vaginatum]
MKKFSSCRRFPLPAMYALAIIVVIAISCSAVVHGRSEARPQDADADAAEGGHQGPAPLTPQGGTPRNPGPPCCISPGG